MPKKNSNRANLKIAGYEQIISQLEQLKEYLYNSESYLKKGIHVPKGVLLYGRPGVGKTVMAKYLASDQINFVELRAADCTRTNSEKYIQDAFKNAKAMKPCLLLIDELDKIAGLNDEYYMEMNDKSMKILLQELDNLKGEQVLVVGTCNDINRLGPALVRSGRFDRIYRIDLPTLEDREKILSFYYDKIDVKKSIDIKYLARMTESCTGAQLENFVNESAIIAVEENNSDITIDCFQKAMDRHNYHCIEGKVNDSTKHITAVHEAGHCLVQLYIKPDTVSGASIIPQGNSEGRSRRLTEIVDRFPGKGELDDVTICLGGRTAEIIEFGTSSTGCSDDMSKAVRAIDYLLTECGMFGYEYLVSYSRYPITSESQFTKIINKRVEILNDQEIIAKKLIIEHKDIFNKIVSILESKLIITREELLGLIA